MKALTLSFMVLVVSSCSPYLIKVPTSPLKPNLAPVEWVHIQKLLLPLFDNICENSTNDIIVRVAKEFTLNASNENFTKSDVVANLRNIQIAKGFLPKGEIFSEYNISHFNELKAVYEAFYYAKDFDTFHKVACWARQNINCGLFVDTLYAAVMNRQDTARISIPAPYEMLPNYFIHKDSVIKAAFLLNENKPDETDEDVYIENNAYILKVNYTTDLNDDEDSKLAYFREDIGLNSYYYLNKLKNTLSLNAPPSNFPNYYGEYMFTMMKQFAARYDLERYSNGLPELESLKLDSIIFVYKPILIYSNGNEFGQRTVLGSLSDSQDFVFLKTIEDNINSIVTHLKQAGHDKMEIVNHLIEILITADKSYETVARHVLGNDVALSERQYSTLEHYLTTLRDPVYWKVNKKIVELIDNALKLLPSYSRNELYFPGVEILNVETKKMITSFDSFYFDVTDSLKPSYGNITYQVKIAQMRLNHKPFSLKLNISSIVKQKGVVKVYLGPKTMPGQLSLKKNLFIILDKFEYELKRGINIISRSSDDMLFSTDLISFQELQKKVEDSEFGLDALPFTEVQTQTRFPSRLILPKGLSEGLPMQLFVFVAPYYKNIAGTRPSINKTFNLAVLSPGYPFDLAIDDTTIFKLPNALVKDITIIHKDESKSSTNSPKRGPKKWDSENYSNSRSYSGNENINYEDFHENGVENSYFDYKEYNEHDLSSEQPSFSYKNNKPNGYAVKNNKFINKDSYFVKLNETNFESHTLMAEQPENPSKELHDFERSGDDTYTVHGLLESQPEYTSKRKERNKYKRTDTDAPNRFEYNKYSLMEKGSKSLSDIHSNEIYKTNTLNHIYENIENTSVNQSFVNKIHGLLGDRPDFTYNNRTNKDYTNKKNQYQNKKEEYQVKGALYNNKDYRKKQSDDLFSHEQNFAPKVKKDSDSIIYFTKLKETVDEMDKNEKHNLINDYNTDIKQSPVEKIHGLLGDRPEFTYKNKAKPDYSEKRNPYKNKKEDYEAKRAQYKNKAYRKKTSDELLSTEQKIEIKFIDLDNGNSLVHQNVDNNKIDKEVYIDKGTTARLDITSENSDIYDMNDKIEEEAITKPVIVLTDSVSSVEENTKISDYIIISEPMPEIPKRRVTVFDYLFNFDNEQNKVYE